MNVELDAVLNRLGARIAELEVKLAVAQATNDAHEKAAAEVAANESE